MNAEMTTHDFDPGYTGLSTQCNALVLDDDGAATDCNRLREEHTPAVEIARVGPPGSSVVWRAERAEHLAQIDAAFSEAKRQWNVPAAHAALSVMRSRLRNADFQDFLNRRYPPEVSAP